jgi:hypothetical protein
MKKLACVTLLLAATTIGLIPPKPTQAQTEPFSMQGRWIAPRRTSCPITFYRDNGQNIEGNCDTGVVDHKVIGTYSRQNWINITIIRKTPGCTTTVQGTIRIINENIVEFSQQGWNGCSVKTPPLSERWFRDLS